MSRDEFENWLREAIEVMNEEDEIVSRVDTFGEAGILSNDNGLVIKTNDGAEFQVTIVQSK